MKKCTNIFILSVLTVLLAVSCKSDFDWDAHYPGGALKKEYADNWVNQMGKIDPEHDWSMAGEYTVTVNVPGSEKQDLRIFAQNSEGTYQFVGEYFDISGTETLIFDAIKGTKSLLICDSNNNYYECDVNCFVELSGHSTTRAIFSGDGDLHIVENEEDFLDFSQNKVNEIKSAIEGWLTQYVKGSPNFLYVPKSRDIILYPIRWSGQEADEIGIYYTNSNGNTVYKKVFAPKQGEELLYTTSTTITGETTWQKCPDKDSYKSDAKFYRSKGIAVTLPEDCKSFGLYVKYHRPILGNKISHSESKKNSGYLRCSTFKLDADSNTYVGLGTAAGADDYFFVVKGALTIDYTSDNWILACEDLGSTGDYDFNDIVLKLKIFSEKKSYSSTKHYAEITPLAAGGTLKANLFYKNQSLGEIHTLLGQGSQDANGLYKMINTNAYKDNVTCDGKSVKEPLSIEIDGNSLSSFFNNFYIKIGEENSYIIQKPDKGEAPQIIIIKDGWNWPSERTDIRDAYPNFVDWSQNSTAVEWSNNMAKDQNGNLVDVFFYQEP